MSGCAIAVCGWSACVGGWDFEVRVKGVGERVRGQRVGFGVWGLTLGVWGLGFGALRSGSMVEG